MVEKWLKVVWIWLTTFYHFQTTLATTLQRRIGNPTLDYQHVTGHLYHYTTFSVKTLEIQFHTGTEPVTWLRNVDIVVILGIVDV